MCFWWALQQSVTQLRVLLAFWAFLLQESNHSWIEQNIFPTCLPCAWDTNHGQPCSRGVAVWCACSKLQQGSQGKVGRNTYHAQDKAARVNYTCTVIAPQIVELVIILSREAAGDNVEEAQTFGDGTILLNILSQKVEVAILSCSLLQNICFKSSLKSSMWVQEFAAIFLDLDILLHIRNLKPLWRIPFLVSMSVVLIWGHVTSMLLVNPNNYNLHNA